MAEYQFTARLNRSLADGEEDLLYEAGLDDAGVETGPAGALLDVTREAPSPADAVESVCADVAKVPGLRVRSVSEVTRARR
jgi:hypothetical protein